MGRKAAKLTVFSIHLASDMFYFNLLNSLYNPPGFASFPIILYKTWKEMNGSLLLCRCICWNIMSYVRIYICISMIPLQNKAAWVWKGYCPQKLLPTQETLLIYGQIYEGRSMALTGFLSVFRSILKVNYRNNWFEWCHFLGKVHSTQFPASNHISHVFRRI